MTNLTVTGGAETVYLDRELRSRLYQLAEDEGLSRNKIINQAVRAFFDSLEE